MERTKNSSSRFLADQNYAIDPDSRRSIVGTVVYLNDIPIEFSNVQKHVMLSLTEAQSAAVVTLVKDIMSVYRVIASMGLHA